MVRFPPASRKDSVSTRIFISSNAFHLMAGCPQCGHSRSSNRKCWARMGHDFRTSGRPSIIACQADARSGAMGWMLGSREWRFIPSPEAALVGW